MTFGAEDDKRNLGADETAVRKRHGLRELARKAGCSRRDRYSEGKRILSDIAVNIVILNA